MGKPTGKKKNKETPKSSDADGKPCKISDQASKAFDEDMEIFINRSQELKEEGNKLFQKRDHEGAMLRYDKALKLLPKEHPDIAYLRTNMASCYMQMGLGEYPNAINECNLALEASPRYSKALLKRARCYEALNKMDLAFRDSHIVVNMEPTNISATEIFQRVRKFLVEKGVDVDEMEKNLVNMQPAGASRLRKVVKEKLRKKKKKKNIGQTEEKTSDKSESEFQKSDKEEDKKSDRSQNEGKKGINEKDKKIDKRESEGKEVDEGEKKKSGESEIEVKKGDNKGDQSKSNRSENEGQKGIKEENNKVDKREGEGRKVDKGEKKKKKSAISDIKRKKGDSKGEEKQPENKIVVEEKKLSIVIEKELTATKIVDGVVTRAVKLVLGEDIRTAQLPQNSSITLVRDIIRDRFPGLKGILVKYRDPEGDLVTITSMDELRLAESSSDSQGLLRLYIAEVSPDQEPPYDGMNKEDQVHKFDKRSSSITENGSAGKLVESQEGSICIENWIIQFAELFKNHVGFDSDSYLDLHELGMKIYSEAMEDTVTGEDAQELFEIAADKFQEMAALALFNWGNVHMSKARKQVSFPEDSSKEIILEKVEAAFEWAQNEYNKAAMRYEEAIKIKPDFYEALLALGQQQFEQAKLCWYHELGKKIDLESEASQEVLKLYNKAEDSMERGMQIWEEMQEQRLNGISKFDKYKAQLQKLGLGGMLNEISDEEAAEQVANMSSQVNLLWGSLLYERSVVEYKLGLPTWEECLEVAVEKFELAGASPTDIAVMIKNHCSNDTALEGMGFKIDEIVQAWNEMYDANRWQIGVPSFRLEPLFRRRASKLHDVLEHFFSGSH